MAGDRVYIGDQHVDQVALFEWTDRATPGNAALNMVRDIELSLGSVSGGTRVVIDTDALFVITYSELLVGFRTNPEAAATHCWELGGPTRRLVADGELQWR